MPTIYANTEKLAWKAYTLRDKSVNFVTDKNTEGMKLMITTLMLTAMTVCTAAHVTLTPQGHDAVKKDLTEQGNDSTATITKRALAKRDTLQLRTDWRTTGKNATKVPQYDVSKEKTEEPWLGGVLKDIIFH